MIKSLISNIMKIDLAYISAIPLKNPYDYTPFGPEVLHKEIYLSPAKAEPPPDAFREVYTEVL